MPIQITCKALRTISEKNLSETTLQMILDISRYTKTRGEEPYIQSLSKITDILEKATTEQETVKMLKEKFPQYKYMTTSPFWLFPDFWKHGLCGVFVIYLWCAAEYITFAAAYSGHKKGKPLFQDLPTSELYLSFFVDKEINFFCIIII